MPTVLHRLEAWASSDPHATAHRYKRDDEWRTISAREFRDRVYFLARFLESQGLGPDSVNVILSYNCPEWVQLDLAALLAGAKSAGIYPNSTSRDIGYILDHTAATVLAVQNRDYFARITADGAPPVPDHVRLIIVFDGDTSIDQRAIAFSDAVARGKQLAESDASPRLQDYLGRLDPKAGAMLIYTSGTTGKPKGALLSHDNLVFACDTVTDLWSIPKGRGTTLSFLPLCHVAEKLQAIGIGIGNRCAVSFCTKFENVSRELREVEPTLLLCVPRLWEKMMEGVLSEVSRANGLRGRIARWALATGEQVASRQYANGRVNAFDGLRWQLADRLVLSKVRRTLGLGRAEILASGAAALPAHVCRWFRSLGLEIREDFGQTETTGILCVTEPGQDNAGTVGKPIPALEFRIADDGEILTRGRHVFVGYFKDHEATRAAFTEDGWLHTGDLGEIDERGLVRIRGRKKEVLKTSGGKMVAPLPIEERLRESPLIGQACVVGDGRKYLSVLLTLSETALSSLRARSPRDIEGVVVEHSETLLVVRRHIDELNRSLAQYEQIKRFTLLSREFSIANGEMTPTMKMKRSVIEVRFKDVIDAMYPGGG